MVTPLSCLLHSISRCRYRLLVLGDALIYDTRVTVPAFDLLNQLVGLHRRWWSEERNRPAGDVRVALRSSPMAVLRVLASCLLMPRNRMDERRAQIVAASAGFSWVLSESRDRWKPLVAFLTVWERDRAVAGVEEVSSIVTTLSSGGVAIAGSWPALREARVVLSISDDSTPDVAILFCLPTVAGAPRSPLVANSLSSRRTSSLAAFEGWGFFTTSS
jgi:hypothetical protein